MLIPSVALRSMNSVVSIYSRIWRSADVAVGEEEGFLREMLGSRERVAA
jgi:deoxyribodipyrimidine photolyase-like uncharacterized protein